MRSGTNARENKKAAGIYPLTEQWLVTGKFLVLTLIAMPNFMIQLDKDAE